MFFLRHLIKWNHWLIRWSYDSKPDKHKFSKIATLVASNETRASKRFIDQYPTTGIDPKEHLCTHNHGWGYLEDKRRWVLPTLIFQMPPYFTNMFRKKIEFVSIMLGFYPAYFSKKNSILSTLFYVFTIL